VDLRIEPCPSKKKALVKLKGQKSLICTATEDKLKVQKWGNAPLFEIKPCSILASLLAVGFWKYSPTFLHGNIFAVFCSRRLEVFLWQKKMITMRYS
jgi:hypothetical protein